MQQNCETLERSGKRWLEGRGVFSSDAIRPKHCGGFHHKISDMVGSYSWYAGAVWLLGDQMGGGSFGPDSP